MGILDDMERGWDSTVDAAGSVGKGALGLLGGLGEVALAMKAPAMYKNIQDQRNYARDQAARTQWANQMPMQQVAQNMAPGAFNDEEAQVAQMLDPNNQVFQPGRAAPSQAEMAQHMFRSPDAAGRAGAAKMMTDRFAPRSAQQPKSMYAKTWQGAEGNTFGVNPETNQVDQLQGAVTPQRDKGPLVTVQNNLADMGNLADKETYKLMGKYRGNRLSSFNKVMDTSRSVADSISETKNMLNDLAARTGVETTGFASLANQIPHLGPKGWLEAKDVIVSRLAVDKMAELKALSPTGSTGFGALSQKELETLQKQLGSLEQSQSPRDIQKNITQILRLLSKSEAKFGKVQADEIKWYNKNRLPNMEEYKAESPGPKAISDMTDDEIRAELGR